MPDTGNPAENRGKVQQNNLRITWQATHRVKIAAEQKVDSWCNCPMYIGQTATAYRAPEAANDRRFPRLRQ